MRIYTEDKRIMHIARRAFPEWRGKKLQLWVSDEDHITCMLTAWSEGSRHRYRLVALEAHSMFSDVVLHAPPVNPLQERDNRRMPLPINGAIVEHSIFRGRDLGCIVWIRRENFARLLPQTETETELSREEKIVLAATAGIKSFARYDEAYCYTGITREAYARAKDKLIEKKLLRKNGSITPDGRNTIGQTRLFDLRKGKK